MMYNNKLVAVVKVNGSVLREDKGAVHIPFGSEYTIQLKNLHTQKAVVSIDIDGDDVCDDSQYVVNPGQTAEIEGFLRGNSIANKFKFIEKTQEISDFRGDQMEDGLIRIEYQFEFEWPTPRCYTYNDGIRNVYGGQRLGGQRLGGQGDSGQRPVSKEYDQFTTYCSSDIQISANCDLNDNGITARGGQSNQMFSETTTDFLDPVIHTMVIQLKGVSRGKIVSRPLTTRARVQCENCGRRWKSVHEFCGNCGTSLR